MWFYPKPVLPRFDSAPKIFETIRAYELPDICALKAGTDVTVEFYGGA